MEAPERSRLSGLARRKLRPVLEAVLEALRTWPGEPGSIRKVPGCTSADVADALGIDAAQEGERTWCRKVAAELARGRVGPDRAAAVANAARQTPVERPNATRECNTLPENPAISPRQPPIVAAETRPDPLLAVVQSVKEPPERVAGRLAFGGIVDDQPAQLPLLKAPEGPRVPMLELTD